MESRPSSALSALLPPLAGFLAVFLAFVVSPWRFAGAAFFYGLAFVRMAILLAKL